MEPAPAPLAYRSSPQPASPWTRRVVYVLVAMAVCLAVIVAGVWIAVRRPSPDDGVAGLLVAGGGIGLVVLPSAMLVAYAADAVCRGRARIASRSEADRRYWATAGERSR